MKKLIAMSLCLFCCFAVASEETWLKSLPSEMARTQSEDIPSKNFFEVSTSKEGTAEYWLAENPFISQTQDAARFFGQHNFQCSSPNELYLVRAIYENGGTGSFTVKKVGTSLLISHMSLGNASGLHRSALMVCLSFKPTGVFYAVGGVL